MRLARHLLGASGLVATGIGLLGVTAGAQELHPCASHPTFSVLGSASASRMVVSIPGRSVVGGADAALPGAQAAVDSVEGSKGWAGAPFVPVVAENAGQAEADANDVPVFAASEHPVTPESSNSTPAATVTAKSEEHASTARAAGGGPGTEQFGAGRAVASAAASCADDGGLRAVADTSTDVTDVAGVLRIGSVRSHALVERDATGEIRKLEGTIAVEGVTVLGQSAAITDRGLVLGPSATPLTANPLTEAIKSAGITVRYLTADLDRQTGEVTAPGLEISIEAPVPNGPPVTTTLVLGRALARADLTPGDPVPTDTGDAGFASPLPITTDVAAPVADLGAPTTDVVTGSAPATADPAPAALATARIGAWSIAPAYSALGVGALLLLAWFLLEKTAVRFPWK